MRQAITASTHIRSGTEGPHHDPSFFEETGLRKVGSISLRRRVAATSVHDRHLPGSGRPTWTDPRIGLIQLLASGLVRYLEIGTQRYNAFGHVTPERHEQFARQCDDSDATGLAALVTNTPSAQRLPGWCRGHSHASWIMVLRKRALPAFEMPCSTSIPPLFQGLGVKPECAADSLRLRKSR
jgi:hypothetical protein